jgi:hypothetical protein
VRPTPRRRIQTVRHRILRTALACATVAWLAAAPGRATPNQTTDTAAAAVQELVVLEAPNCTYCAVFRRDVLPQYLLSKRAGDLPIRFVDINDPAADRLKLAAAVTQVPTIVLLERGTETGRITGYWGPEAFFKGIAQMLRTPR